MLRTVFLSLILLVSSEIPSIGADEADLGVNAALKYWQAFAQLPKFADGAETNLQADCLTMPLDTKAREIVDNGDYALRMMHRGAALEGCNWGLDYEEGIDVLLPHLPAARTMASLACLRARLRFEDGQDAHAADDLVAALALARHVSRDGSLIAVLVGYNIEHHTSEVIARHLPRLNAAMVKKLKGRLEALPPSGTPAAALLTCEQSTIDWLGRRVREANDEESLLVFLNALCGERGDSPEKHVERGRAFLQECGGTPEGIIKFADQTRASYLLMAKKFDLPLAEFETQYKLEVENQAENPVFKLLFPAIVKVRSAQMRNDIRRALLSAALAVQLEGREALQRHPDPVLGASFEFVPFEGGFELRSKFQESNDEPLTLTVGAGEK